MINSSKKKSEVPKKNLHRRRLSFSNDESSSTSEFDPGDYVPPKNIYKKGKKYLKNFNKPDIHLI